MSPTRANQAIMQMPRRRYVDKVLLCEPFSFTELGTDTAFRRRLGPKDGLGEEQALMFLFQFDQAPSTRSNTADAGAPGLSRPM